MTTEQVFIKLEPQDEVLDSGYAEEQPIEPSQDTEDRPTEPSQDEENDIKPTVITIKVEPPYLENGEYSYEPNSTDELGLLKVKIEPEDRNDVLPEPSQQNPFVLKNFLDHVLDVGNDGLNCPVCHKTFASARNVKRHMFVHAETHYECTVCNQKLLTAEELHKHTNRHELKFGCSICGERFSEKWKLRKHGAIHSDEKYQCDRCKKCFSHKANLSRHKSKTTNCRPADEIICHVCHKAFKREFLLKSHLKKHDTSKDFECDLCQMAFKHKSTLIRHLQWHNGIRPYKCPNCPKTFTHSGLLKPHLRTHTGEKPFQCPICKKFFSHKHNMMRHKLRHNVIKKLVCDICHKKFPRESRLVYHMRTHTNEKFFDCHVCSRKFTHKQNAIRHYSRKHPHTTYRGKETDASVAFRVWDKEKNEFNSGVKVRYIHNPQAADDSDSAELII